MKPISHTTFVKKYSIKDKIFIKNSDFKKIEETEINYKEVPDNIIRVIKGTNFDYFSTEAQNNFFNKEFSVTKLADRMGIRLSGPKLENIVSSNIKSEGLVKGLLNHLKDQHYGKYYFGDLYFFRLQSYFF